MSAYRLFIVDCDGTVLDSTRLTMDRFIEVAKIMGIDFSGLLNFLKTVWGLPYIEIIRLVCEKTGNLARVDEFLKIKSSLPSLKYKVDAKLLQTLWDLCSIKNHKLVMITNRTGDSLKRLQEDCGFDIGMYHQIITPETCPIVKPNPLIFFQIPNILAYEIYSIGDTLFDLATVKKFNESAVKNKSNQVLPSTRSYARKPGLSVPRAYLANVREERMEFIAVSSGVNNRRQFIEAGVTNIVEGVSGLAPYLQDRFLRGANVYEGGNNSPHLVSSFPGWFFSFFKLKSYLKTALSIKTALFYWFLIVNYFKILLNFVDDSYIDFYFILSGLDIRTSNRSRTAA